LSHAGKGAPDDYRAPTAMAHTLIERAGAATIIVAGTDLSLLFETTFPAIDCAQPHIDAIPRAQGLTA
jgi:aspartate/glutamate racemase